MSYSYRFQLRDAKLSSSALVLRVSFGTFSFRLGIGQSVDSAIWNQKTQKCNLGLIRNKSLMIKARALNTLLEDLSFRLDASLSVLKVDADEDDVREQVEDVVCEVTGVQKKVSKQVEKKNMTPLKFFKKYIDEKKIDKHTGRYINERTKIHQRTVLLRLSKFFKGTKTPDDWAVFHSPKFDEKYTEWCYKTMKYKQNTVYATYGVLKSWLNAAKAEGYDVGEEYRNLKGKGVDVDAIYLTEDEITAIYKLDIPSLVSRGLVDAKSEMEISRDIFVVGCWTGLRRSDLRRLNDAIYDIEKKFITITAEKTKQRVVIPMHPYVLELYNKYNGVFPTMVYPSKAINHLKECARLAGIDSLVSITENRGGVVKSVKYQKYQLVGIHTARRSFATNMYKRGLPTISIMQLTGHTTETNFLKYIKITKEENAEMVAKQIADWFSAKSKTRR